MQKVTITVSAVDAAAFIASLDMAKALCEQRLTHWNAGDHLTKLRAELMDAYVHQVDGVHV